MITSRYIIGFSGHRHLTPEQEQATATALTTIFGELHQLAAPHGACELYSSIAYGADQIAVRAADAVQIPVHLILPKPLTEGADDASNRGFEADFCEPGKERPDALAFAIQRTAAARVAHGGGSCRISPFTDKAPECYYDTGLQILNACDVLVVVWNQKDAAGLGGTQQWVTQADRLGLPVIIFNPESRETHRHRLERFMEDSGAAIVREIAATAAAEKRAALPGETPSCQLFHRLDEAAIRLGREFRNHLVHSILLHGAATTVAAIAAIIISKDSPWRAILIGLAALESGILLWLMWRNHRIHRSHVHEKWIETRFAAELLRSQIAAGPLLDPLHPLIANHHHPEWRRFALSAGLHIHREQPPQKPFHDQRRDYLENRLRHKDVNQGQIAHYQSQQQVAERRFQLFMRWGRFFTNIATYFVIGALLLKIYKAVHTGDTPLWAMVIIAIFFTLFPIILPLAGGIFLSLRSALDTGRRTYRYRQLTHRLETAAASIEALETPASVRRAVATTEDMLLDELIEWRLAEEQNGGH